MKQIDELALESDVEYRYQYVAEFTGFGPEDVKAIHASAGFLAPRIPEIVETTYDRLLSYDATARHFVDRQHGFDGPLNDSLASLSKDDPQIKFRKEHLSRYLMQLLGRAYDQKMVCYLDMAAKIHTPKAGNKEILVPLVQMNALMGVLSNALIEVILDLNMDAEKKRDLLLAFNKILWIQNDLISRQYQPSDELAVQSD